MFLLGSSALGHDGFPVQAQAHKFHTFGVDIQSFLSNADLQEFDKMHGVCTVHVCTYFLYPPQLGARLIDDRGVLSTSLHLKTMLNTKFYWAWVYKDWLLLWDRPDIGDNDCQSCLQWVWLKAKHQIETLRSFRPRRPPAPWNLPCAKEPVAMILHPTQRCSWGMLLVQCSRRSTVSQPLWWPSWPSWMALWHRWIGNLHPVDHHDIISMQQAPRAAVKSFPARCAKSMSSWTNDQKQSGSPWLPLYDRGRRRPSDKLRDFLYRNRRFGISQGPQDYQSGDTTLGDHHGNRCCYWLSQVSAAVWAEGYEASAPTWDDDCGNANGQSRCYSSRSSSTSTE